jgi:hypothetical protein
VVSVAEPSPKTDAPRKERPDLWLLAYDRVGFDEEQTKPLLTPSDGNTTIRSPLDFVERVRNLIIDRYAKCKSSGWTNSEQLVKSLSQSRRIPCSNSKEIVSAGFKFDVSGNGATSWSIVTFGLQVCSPLLLIAPK